MMFFRIAAIVLALFLLTACFDDKSDPPTDRAHDTAPTGSNASDGDSASQSGSAGNSRYANTKTIYCKMSSQDDQRVTTSSFFKYNPNTVDKITMDRLGDYPDQDLLDRLNYDNERYHLKDARIEIPLVSGNQVFPLDIDNIWFSGHKSIQFFKANKPGELTHRDQGTIFFGKRTGDVTFEGTIIMTEGDALSPISGGWHYAPDGNPEAMEFGSLECRQKHY